MSKRRKPRKPLWDKLIEPIPPRTKPMPPTKNTAVTIVRIRTVHLLKNVYFMIPTLHYVAHMGTFLFGTELACTTVRVELAIVGDAWQDPTLNRHEGAPCSASYRP